MGNQEQNIINFARELIRFTKLFDSKNYFEVIILSVQLFESIALDIQYSKEYMEMENLVGGFTDGEHRRWLAIYDECQSILDKYRGRESARVKFIEMLYQDYNVHEKSWVTTSLIQKVNRIFSFRNKIAHDYYKDTRIRKHLRIRAEECLDVLEKLVYHEFYD